jgi:hypothetical protein
MASSLCRAALSAPTFDIGLHCLGNVKTCYDVDKEDGNDTSFYHRGVIARAIAHYGYSLTVEPVITRSSTVDQIAAWKGR